MSELSTLHTTMYSFIAKDEEGKIQQMVEATLEQFEDAELELPQGWSFTMIPIPTMLQ